MVGVLLIDGTVAYPQPDTVVAAADLARVWSSYSRVNGMADDFRDLKQHGVGLVAVDARDPKQAAEILSTARQSGMQLAISVGDVTEAGVPLRSKGHSVPEALMIGGAYAGKAIDRHLFRFSASPQSIVIEPPVYNRKFAYTLGSGATGRQVKGEPMGHYYPDMPAPVRAEVIVPLKLFDGQQHLRVVPASIEPAEAGASLDKDSVGPDFPSSSEVQERRLYRLRFDLTGLGTAQLDKVGLAVYWPYRGTSKYWIFGRGSVTAASPEAVEATRMQVRDEIAKWTAANGGSFPRDTVRAFRYGDECFFITGGVTAEADAVSYPLWDYSPEAITDFRRAAGHSEYPRTWGYPEVYGEDAYALWLYRLHSNCARLVQAARSALNEVAPSVLLFRNTTRFGVFHPGNDHDGSGAELLTAATDIVHLDPYPVNGAGYQPVIPRDMSYYGGLARRYQRLLIPWMQAHTYGGSDGLQDVTPSQVRRMVEEQRLQGVDGMMWLGYGKTFPNVAPDSWEEAGRLAHAWKGNSPSKPQASLAVLRPYRKWALSAVANGSVRNPADWMLQQFLEVWSVQSGQAYDVFELPPSLSDNELRSLREQLRRYPHVVGTERFSGVNVWLIGDKTESSEVNPAKSSEYQEMYKKEISRRGWIRTGATSGAAL